MVSSTIRIVHVLLCREQQWVLLSTTQWVLNTEPCRAQPKCSEISSSTHRRECKRKCILNCCYIPAEFSSLLLSSCRSDRSIVKFMNLPASILFAVMLSASCWAHLVERILLASCCWSLTLFESHWSVQNCEFHIRISPSWACQESGWFLIQDSWIAHKRQTQRVSFLVRSSYQIPQSDRSICPSIRSSIRLQIRLTW